LRVGARGIEPVIVRVATRCRGLVISSLVPLVLTGQEDGSSCVAGDAVAVAGRRRAAGEGIGTVLSVASTLPVVQPVGEADRIVPVHKDDRLAALSRLDRIRV